MKKELIEKIMSLTHPTQDIAYVGKGFLQQILEEELPDFQRIDEERFKEMWLRMFRIQWEESGSKAIVDEYNSTLPPALVPLPKEMPKDLTRFAMGHDVDEVWDKIISEYGTYEQKPNLPSVEELERELRDTWHKSNPCSTGAIFKVTAQHLHSKYSLHPKQPLPSYHDLFKELYQISVKSQSTILISTLTKHLISKYSLHPKQEEWWERCDKFMYKGKAYKKYSHQVFPDGRTFLHSELSRHDLQDCTPYTPPTAQDIIKKHNLTEEEVRAIREGK